MTGPRSLLLAVAVLTIGVDLARTGSIEYARRAEIARTRDEIGALRSYREDLRSATQQRLLAQLVTDPDVSAPEMARFRSPSAPGAPGPHDAAPSRWAFAEEPSEPESVAVPSPSVRGPGPVPEGPRNPMTMPHAARLTDDRFGARDR